MVSEDIVSIEQASIDMLLKAAPLPASLASDMEIKDGEDVLTSLHNKPYMIQINEAVRLGLGSRKYEIIKLD